MALLALKSKKASRHPQANQAPRKGQRLYPHRLDSQPIDSQPLNSLLLSSTGFEAEKAWQKAQLRKQCVLNTNLGIV